jgi:glyoxylase-like metal-dependent hydrolase (beta-lactamase superfamily II)
LLTPGHTPGSQTVVVSTSEGPYLLVGDNFYTEKQYTDCIMNGNFTDLEGWYSSRDKVQNYIEENGGKILCVHNPNAYGQEFFG